MAAPFQSPLLRGVLLNEATGNSSTDCYGSFQSPLLRGVLLNSVHCWLQPSTSLVSVPSSSGSTSQRELMKAPIPETQFQSPLLRGVLLNLPCGSCIAAPLEFQSPLLRGVLLNGTHPRGISMPCGVSVPSSSGSTSQRWNERVQPDGD